MGPVRTLIRRLPHRVHARPCQLSPQPENLAPGTATASESHSCRTETAQGWPVVSSMALETHFFQQGGGGRAPGTIAGGGGGNPARARAREAPHGAESTAPPDTPAKPFLSLLLEMSAAKPQGSVPALQPACCPAHPRGRQGRSSQDRPQAHVEAHPYHS